MAGESQYPSESYSNKRKYEGKPALPRSTRRLTSFSSRTIPSASPDPKYAAVPPPFSYSSTYDKPPRVENGASDGKKMSRTPPFSVSYGSFLRTTQKIGIPNMKVGVIIGKGGETIKQLQLQSGAKIQVTSDMDADSHAQTRTVDLTGTPEQISKAEHLINRLLQETEAGGPAGQGGVSRRNCGQPGSDQFVMKIPMHKVGLVIGKGGETIKSMQAKTGARMQFIAVTPGIPTPEQTLQVYGTSDQIELAKQLVNDTIREITKEDLARVVANLKTILNRSRQSRLERLQRKPFQ